MRTGERAPVTVMLLVNDLQPGGMRRRVVELSRGLDKIRFRVLTATLRDDGFVDGELPGLRTVEARGPWDLRSVFHLTSLLRREEVDVLHTMGSPATGLGLVAGRVAGTPVRIAAQQGTGSSGARDWLQRRMMRTATAITTDSEKEARQLISGGVNPAKVNVIYDGLPAEAVHTNIQERQETRYEHGVLDESWLVGIYADGTDVSGHACVLQAASMVRAEVPGTKFMLLGSGMQRSELIRRATILGLDGSVIMAGCQPDTARYVGALDIAVVIDGDGASFGMQAMALGRPIVATDAGSNAELFPMGEAGLLAPPDNPLILAHAVLEVMRHPDAVERMRKRGRQMFAERFTSQRMIGSYEELYLDLWTRAAGKGTLADAKPADSESS